MPVDVVVTRELAATPDRVWQALTTAELAEWFWPPRFETSVEIDPVPGGAFRVSSEPMELFVDARVMAAVAPRELVLDWAWRGEDATTTVTVSLADAASGTLLTLTHAGNADDEAAGDHKAGWESCLDRLPAHLER